MLISLRFIRTSQAGCSPPIKGKIFSIVKMDQSILVKKVMIVRRVYLALVILLAISTITSIFVQSNIRKMLEWIVFVIVYGAIYFGLRYMKDWVIHLVLITSSFSCFWFVIRILIPSVDITALIFKVLAGLLVFFFGYQIILLRKPEVRKLFGSKGREVF